MTTCLGDAHPRCGRPVAPIEGDNLRARLSGHYCVEHRPCNHGYISNGLGCPDVEHRPTPSDEFWNDHPATLALRAENATLAALAEEAVKLGMKSVRARRNHAVACFNAIIEDAALRAHFLGLLGDLEPPFKVGQLVWTTNLGRQHHCTPCHPKDARQVRVTAIEPRVEYRGGWCATDDTGLSYASEYMRAEPPPAHWTYKEGQQIELLMANGRTWVQATILLRESWAPEVYSVRWCERCYAGWVGLERLRPLGRAPDHGRPDWKFGDHIEFRRGLDDWEKGVIIAIPNSHAPHTVLVALEQDSSPPPTGEHNAHGVSCGNLMAVGVGLIRRPKENK